MARTTLFAALRRCARLAWSAELSGAPTREHVEELNAAHWHWTRRELLQRSLAAAAVATMPLGGSACSRLLTPRRATGPRIAVVGAGMAGLHCAYRLAQAGLAPTVFEASGRVGGRMLTARGRLADGQVAELGAEFVDTNHVCMHTLAGELGVELADITRGEPGGHYGDVYFIGGRAVSEEEIVDAFRPLAADMARTVARADTDPAEFTRIDTLSIADYLDGVAEASAVIKTLIEIAYISEYGLEADEQSALNLLYFIEYLQPDPFRIYGESDERYHAHDGNDLITTRLATSIESHIETHSRLVALRELSSGSYRLTFNRDGSHRDRDFDHVVLALPFTVLRSIDLQVPFSPEKRRVIAELGCGTNAKLIGRFLERPWREQEATGTSFTDNGLQCTWDCTRGQPGAGGALTTFLGGRAGEALGQGTPEERMRTNLPLIDQIFPGAAAAYATDSAMRMHWPTAPFALGSYSCYRPGQWSFYGIEGARAGNLHFCGEQCSLDFQGFMEGACETGALTAAEILNDISIPYPPALQHVLHGRQAGEAVRDPTLPQPLKRRRGRNLSFDPRMIRRKAA